MTDPISASPSQAAQEATRFQNDQPPQDNDPSAFLNVLDKGLGTLSQRPELSPPATDMMDNMTGAYVGDVGQAKGEIVGGEAARAEQSTEAGNATLEDRVKNLYTELTHYQVAWKIAQNVQRDISQVLRGS